MIYLIISKNVIFMSVEFNIYLLFNKETHFKINKSKVKSLRNYSVSKINFFQFYAFFWIWFFAYLLNDVLEIVKTFLSFLLRGNFLQHWQIFNNFLKLLFGLHHKENLGSWLQKSDLLSLILWHSGIYLL